LWPVASSTPNPPAKRILFAPPARALSTPAITMPEKHQRTKFARRVLAVVFALGIVLALLAGAFAPALPGSAAIVRVGALVVGAICVGGLVWLGRPREPVGTPGARPVCPQCGQDLTDVAAQVSGRTTCPSCEMTWALQRDEPTWREGAPAGRAASPGVDPDASIMFPGSDAAKHGAGPSRRSVRRARRRALATWMAILIVSLFVAGTGAFLIPTIFWGLGRRVVMTIYTVAFGFLPLGIAIAGVVAFVRAGRSSAPRR